MASLRERLRRGHLLSRGWGRIKRELQAATTTLVLSSTRPRATDAAVVTLNADEENATVQAVLLGQDLSFARITLVSPSPEISEVAVGMAARRLELPVPDQLRFRNLSYRALLSEYRQSRETYSTHVLLPGRDFSNRRRHVHLTHGSGPKPDATFRSPANVLASITPQWVPQQLKEYQLPADTEVIDYMPRLEIMRRSVGDISVLERLGLDPTTPLVVWAPTYRRVTRGTEVRTSGQPISASAPVFMAELTAAAAERNATLVVKPHPHEADDYASLGLPIWSNERLRQVGVTTYELFGVADLVITDYSSIYLERMALGLGYIILTHDHAEFARSYRGFRRA